MLKNNHQHFFKPTFYLTFILSIASKDINNIITYNRKSNKLLEIYHVFRTIYMKFHGKPLQKQKTTIKLCFITSLIKRLTTYQ